MTITIRPATQGDIPADFRKEYRLGRVVTTLMSIFRREPARIIPLKRDG